MNRRELIAAGFASWLGIPACAGARTAFDPLLRIGDEPRSSDPKPVETAPAEDGALGAAQLRSSVAGLPDDGVLAIVEGEPVAARDVVGLLYLQEPEAVFGVLEQAIRRRLVGFESQRLSVFVKRDRLESSVDRFVKEQMAAFHMKRGPEVDFAKYMEEIYGTSTKAYRAILADVALENLLLERVVRYAARASDRVQFRLLALDSLEKAKEVHAKLVEGANFGALAKAESKDARARENGGLVPPVPAESDHSVAVAVSKLKPGELTDIRSETKFGKTIYWIARLEKRLPKDPRPYGEVAAEIDAELSAAPLDEVELILWDQDVRKRYEIAVRLGRA